MAQLGCKQIIPKTLWDVKGNKAKGKSREARNINLALDNIKAHIIKSFYKRNDMSMLELTPDFIKEFAAYLSTEAGLHNGTIWGKCMWLQGGQAFQLFQD